MRSTIIKALFDYFASCPLMTGKRINVNYLPEDTKGAAGAEYSIDIVPCDEIIKQYKDGGAYCRYAFVIGSIDDYGADETKNLGNSGFYEDLSAWLRQQTRARRLPVLPDGFMPRSIKALGAGYLYFPDVNAARYQIQCELEYYRKGDF